MRIVRSAITVALVSLALVAALLAFQFRKASHVSQSQAFGDKLDKLGEIFGELAFPSTGVTVTNNREILVETLRMRHEALAKMRTNASAFLPGLMEEVHTIGIIEATNKSAAVARTEQVSLAFEALGGEARPLLPKLIKEFNAGRSIGPCVIAFRHIGGTDCGMILVSSLTNSNPLIRNAAMSVLPGFATNRDVVLTALPSLLFILKDNSAFSRALASSVLGSLGVRSDAVVSALLQTAKSDSNFVTRISAIKALGQLSTDSAAVRSELEAIAANDEEPHVRRIAIEVLRVISARGS